MGCFPQNFTGKPVTPFEMHTRIFFLLGLCSPRCLGLIWTMFATKLRIQSFLSAMKIYHTWNKTSTRMNPKAFLKNLQAFSNFLMTRRKILAEILTPMTDLAKKAQVKALHSISKGTSFLLLFFELYKLRPQMLC